jgi:hypothetical protein
LGNSALVKQVDYFKEIGKHLKLKDWRNELDLEMIRELGIAWN